MKIAGIVLAIFGGIQFIVGFAGVAQGIEAAGKSITGGIVFIVLGIFLISRANKKKQKETERKEWEENK